MWTWRPLVDKRSRESPDSTLKPEGKSLKTSGVATATIAESDAASACATDIVAESDAASACATDIVAPDEGDNDVPKVPTIRWKVKSIAEARRLMWQLPHCMPAWKSKALVESLQIEPVDLTALAEAPMQHLQVRCW